MHFRQPDAACHLLLHKPDQVRHTNEIRWKPDSLHSSFDERSVARDGCCCYTSLELHSLYVTKQSMSDKKPTPQDTGASPGEFLKEIQNKPVVVKLNSGVDYRGAAHSSWPNICHRAIMQIDQQATSIGVLVCIDGYMNIAMEQTEEFVEGQLKNNYGDAFIRGNNVLHISAAKQG